MSSRDIRRTLPCPAPGGTSRRHLLLGLGALAVGPVAVGPVAVAAPVAASAVEPECLADLIETGLVDRGDLVAR